MDRLEVIAELLRISFACLPHRKKNIVHVSLLPRPAIHQVCKSLAARSRSLGKQTQSDPAALRWQCACNSKAVNLFSAKAVGHMVPSWRFASCMKPNVSQEKSTRLD
jgi:hypothetical protein